jgi:hypothetical protein
MRKKNCSLICKFQVMKNTNGSDLETLGINLPKAYAG